MVLGMKQHAIQTILLQRIENFLIKFHWKIFKKMDTILCGQLIKSWRLLQDTQRSITTNVLKQLPGSKLTKEKLSEMIGYFLRHCYEFCIMARNKGSFGCLREKSKTHTAPNVIFAELREQSRKPHQIYEIIEQLVPNGRYLEIFPRPHNQRPKWTGIGNESILWKKIRTKLRKQQRDKQFQEQIQKSQVITLS
ncbi:MT-A70 family protein [Oxytricha trifallax]|uniref:mRNA m(6)A methyltransferase n=1 Tax=Oxytricha trifallax TaxID=1172189 RepID=A0A073I0L3_9SPIT|nr:MT-A70 family protein [Oxytricha trifallax]